MEKKQSGFTLVELVTAITIVGVLAAVAIPRFANMSADARTGVIKNTAGAMKQANDTIFSKASSANITNLSSTTDSLGTVVINSFANVKIPDGKGGFVTIITHYGYARDAQQLYNAMVQNPDLVVGSDSATALITDRDRDLFKFNSGLLENQPIAPNSALQHTKAALPAKCEVGYTQALNSNTAPILITVVTDCS